MINMLSLNTKRLNKKKLNTKRITVDPSLEAIWIRENCTKKFSVDDIMEILDYEMAYLASLGLVNLSKKEIEENLEYWAKRNG